MPHDLNGKLLTVGDRVLIPAVVSAINSDQETYCNITIKYDEGMAPDVDGDFSGNISARQVAKVDHHSPAIYELERALDVMTTNSPVNKAEGNLEQAALEDANAIAFIEMIKLLSGQAPRPFMGDFRILSPKTAVLEVDSLPKYDPDQLTLGNVAYDAYAAARGWLSVLGQKLPEYRAQDPAIVAAWEDAATSAIKAKEDRDKDNQPVLDLSKELRLNNIIADLKVLHPEFGEVAQAPQAWRIALALGELDQAANGEWKIEKDEPQAMTSGNFSSGDEPKKCAVAGGALGAGALAGDIGVTGRWLLSGGGIAAKLRPQGYPSELAHLADLAVAKAEANLVRVKTAAEFIKDVSDEKLAAILLILQN